MGEAEGAAGSVVERAVDRPPSVAAQTKQHLRLHRRLLQQPRAAALASRAAGEGEAVGVADAAGGAPRRARECTDQRGAGSIYILHNHSSIPQVCIACVHVRRLVPRSQGVALTRNLNTLAAPISVAVHSPVLR